MEWKNHVWTIGAIIYVLGMFPIYYLYQVQGDAGFSLVDLVATFGCFLVLGQAFWFMVPDNKPPSQVPSQMQQPDSQKDSN